MGKQRETHSVVANVVVTHICCDEKKISSVDRTILVFEWVEDKRKVESVLLQQNHEIFDHGCPNCVVVVSWCLHWEKQQTTAETRDNDSF